MASSGSISAGKDVWNDKERNYNQNARSSIGMLLNIWSSTDGKLLKLWVFISAQDLL